jgi:hypothetical protein
MRQVLQNMIFALLPPIMLFAGSRRCLLGIGKIKLLYFSGIFLYFRIGKTKILANPVAESRSIPFGPWREALTCSCSFFDPSEEI